MCELGKLIRRRAVLDQELQAAHAGRRAATDPTTVHQLDAQVGQLRKNLALVSEHIRIINLGAKNAREARVYDGFTKVAQAKWLREAIPEVKEIAPSVVSELWLRIAPANNAWGSKAAFMAGLAIALQLSRKDLDEPVAT